MIAFLKGKIVYINEKEVCILTHSGVWYKAIINDLTYSNLLSKEEAEIFVYHHVTENSESLFGFTNKEEENVFIELIKISGIGWKVAMNILGMWVQNLIKAVKLEDQKAVESVNWIWKKWAQKIILELKDKDFVKSYSGVADSKVESPEQKNLYSKEVYDTLVWMGFPGDKVDSILSNLPENIQNIEDVIPYAIRNLSS